jgi:hypothetical protein
MLHENIKLMDGGADAHPMGVFVSTVSAFSPSIRTRRDLRRGLAQEADPPPDRESPSVAATPSAAASAAHIYPDSIQRRQLPQRRSG